MSYILAVIRIITLTLALLAIAVLLANGVATFVSGVPESDSEQSSVSSRIPETSREADSSSDFLRPSQASTQEPEATVEPISPLSLFANVAMQRQIESQLTDFVSPLAASPEREEQLMNAFKQAYTDATKMAASDDPLNRLAKDPNFIVNAMAEHLDARELAQLEEYLESESRNRFENNYSSQIDVISPTLSEGAKQQLLDVFFEENYAATNPHGATVSRNSRAYVSKQLEALDIAAQRLSQSLSGPDAAMVSEFFTQQKRGLELAASLFAQ